MAALLRLDFSGGWAEIIAMSTILTAETEAALDRIAASSGKSREQLANDALLSYVAWYETEEQANAGTPSEIDHGTFEHEELFRELEARYAPVKGISLGGESYEADFIKAVEAGLSDEAAGRLIDHKEFVSRWYAERPDSPRAKT